MNNFDILFAKKLAGGGGGGGFTPTEAQLTAMNSGIDSTKVAQIETNKNDIVNIKEVPTVESSDNGKVLKASYNKGVASYSWETNGGGGTSDYSELSNKPQINNVTLSGNKTSSDLGLQPTIDSTHKLSANLIDGLATVASTGAYSDLTDTPTIPTVPITEIQKNGTAISPVSGAVNIVVPTTAADINAIPTSAKGTASGVAELDSNGKVPSSQLPSYVDDVIEGYYYDNKFYEEAAHTTEITGETGKIYIDLSGTNKTYRWSGSGYTEISESLALGETSSTAYRGDRGKVAYSHATETRLTTATASGLYKVASTAQGHIASLTSVQKSDITALGIPAQDTTYGYASQSTAGLVRCWTTTDGTSTTLHIATEAPSP